MFARVFFRSSFSNVFQPSEGKAQEALQLGIQDLLTAEGRVLQLSHSLSEEGLKHGDAITATGLKHGDWTGVVVSFFWVFVAIHAVSTIHGIELSLYDVMRCHSILFKYISMCLALRSLQVTVRGPKLSSTAYAFALVKVDGSVVTWGDPDAGADSREVQPLLRNVEEVYGTCFAFAALLTDGSVITWGHPESGGDSSGVELKNVQRIVSSTACFAAQLRDGRVITWGRMEGKSSEVVQQLRDVQRIEASGRAFAALLANGSVVTWGDPDFGGDSRSVRQHLTKGISSLAASDRAFAAVKTDGSVVTWGHCDCGGDSSEVGPAQNRTNSFGFRRF